LLKKPDRSAIWGSRGSRYDASECVGSLKGTKKNQKGTKKTVKTNTRRMAGWKNGSPQELPRYRGT